MRKLNCPHCGKPGISAMRKICLGPAVTATCKTCGKKVGVPYMSMLAVVPFLAAIFGSALAERSLVHTTSARRMRRPQNARAGNAYFGEAVPGT